MDTICRLENCTLCMACANICPHEAIDVTEDNSGYEKIVIDQKRCVDCGLCLTVCNRRAEVARQQPRKCYAAQAKKRDQLRKSASGGVFQMLATHLLENGGVCYGAAFEHKNGRFCAAHTRVNSLDQLPKILNTKYIPSLIGTTFSEAKKDLQQGKIVLFSGTPCQILGLKAFLGKEWENLLTVDLVCHGVSSTALFNGYIQQLQEQDGIEIQDFCFRDKSIGWGTNYCYRYTKKNGARNRSYTVHESREMSSYITHYLRGDFSRKNCYSCPLSNAERVGDFSLGDFWGIDKAYPEMMLRAKHPLSLKGGVSCMLVNTIKGQQYMTHLETNMKLHEVDFSKIVKYNANLREPTRESTMHDEILRTYQKEGYAQIEREHRKKIKKKYWKYKLKNIMRFLLPSKMRVLGRLWAEKCRHIFKQSAKTR